MDKLSDEELIAQFRARGSQAGDPHLNLLFQRNYQKVSLWCLRFTGNKESAADLAQEVFLNVHRHLESFRGDAKFSTWLFTVTRNHCRNRWRSSQAAPEQSLEPALELVMADTSPDAHAQLESSQLTNLMRQFMQESLEPTEQRVMTLHYVDEMPLDAITRLLGLTNSSGAKAHVVSARRKLNAAVARWKEGTPNANP